MLRAPRIHIGFQLESLWVHGTGLQRMEQYSSTVPKISAARQVSKEVGWPNIYIYAQGSTEPTRQSPRQSQLMASIWQSTCTRFIRSPEGGAIKRCWIKRQRTARDVTEGSMSNQDTGNTFIYLRLTRKTSPSHRHNKMNLISGVAWILRITGGSM